MGERAILQDGQAGQFSLNDFFGQGDNQVTPRDLIPTILPVIDLRTFTRKFRVSTSAIIMTIGQVLTDLRWTVPRGEWWKLHGILMENTDSVPHFAVVRMTFARGADSRGGALWHVSRVQVGTNFTQPIYGLTQQNTTSTTFSSAPDIILEAGDSVIVQDLTAIADASTSQGFQIVYELVPQPTQVRTQGVVGAAIVT